MSNKNLICNVYNKSDLELLAPCGDMDSFNTAIACGADAVYLGLSDFNARRKAENFTAENICEVVSKAHFYGVKVYLTVNTLVYDNEMRNLIDLIRTAVNAKVDAYIVQDLGVASCLKRAFPNIVLHASTQLGVHNLYGARQAEKFGFTRVVLSRETKLDDIRVIREGTNLEIEYFVQGALCVAFSGNCYLSATECGASGNRGLCKQLCRLPYKAEVNGKSAQGYLLSAKDLCLANSLKELAEAGVTSFKIEGRMRRDGYVGTAVNVYRNMLDNISKGVKIGGGDMKNLRIAYSRGDNYLERAYLDGGTPSVIEKQFNNHTGIKIGVVKSVKPFKSDLFEVAVQSSYPIQKGDGLKFFAVSGAEKGYLKEVASAGVGDVKAVGNNTYSFVTKSAIKAGWQVNLILSREQDENLKNITRKVEVDFVVRAIVGNPLYIKATSGGVSAEAYGDICQQAVNAPTSADTLLEQVKKVGDSGFSVRKADVHADNVFVAKSAVNALRRQVVDELAQKLADVATNVIANEFEIDKILGENTPFLHENRVRFYHSDEVKDGASIVTDIRKTELAVLCPNAYTKHEIQNMLSALSLTQDKAALQLPVIANGKDIEKIKSLLSELPNLKTLVSENIYGFEFAKMGFTVIAGAGHNVLNKWSYAVCKELGAADVLPAPESAVRKNICGDELPLMTFAHCPFKTVFENDCANCTYQDGMILTREKHKYAVRRTKITNCYFGLYKI